MGLLDRLTKVWDNGKRTAEYTYYPDDSIKSLRNGESLYTEYAYDKDKNLTFLKTVLGTEVLVENRYRYDGNIDMTFEANEGPGPVDLKMSRGNDMLLR